MQPGGGHAELHKARLQKACGMSAGVANSEITFGDTIDDPPVKKRHKAGKAGMAAAEEAAQKAEAVTSGSPDQAEAQLAAADSEPAELTRTGVKETVADAAAGVPPKSGKRYTDDCISVLLHLTCSLQCLCRDCWLMSFTCNMNSLYFLSVSVPQPVL